MHAVGHAIGASVGHGAPVDTFAGCPIITLTAFGPSPLRHAVGVPAFGVFGHAVVGAVESHIRDAVVALDASGLLYPRGEVSTDLAEDGNLALEYFLVGADRHLAGDVVDEALFGTVVKDLLPQCSGGIEVFGPNLGQEGDGIAGELVVDFVQLDGSLTELDRIDRAEVIWSRALVEECHLAIALEISMSVRSAWSIDRQLLVVDANPVTVGVRVREETRLKDGIGRGLNSGRHVRRVEGDLLHLGKVILDVLIEHKFADLTTWEHLLRPDVGEVKDVDLLLLPKLFSFTRCHCLHFNGPFWKVTLFNRLEQISLRIIG